MKRTPLSVPHTTEWVRHADVPYLWKGRCLCGWSAMAGTEELIVLACKTHVEEEEPFPEHFDLTPEDPSHGPQ